MLPLGLNEKIISGIGITHFGVIDTPSIRLSEDVRAYCAGNMCRNYGATWACPPAVGSLEECREKILRFDRALVFSTVYPLEDSFDFEAMSAGHRDFKAVCDRLYERLSGDFLLLSNEGCIRCARCSYPDAPCRFPEKLFPSLEGFGIFVNELAGLAGIPYKAGENTVSYFGMLCYNESR